MEVDGPESDMEVRSLAFLSKGRKTVALFLLSIIAVMLVIAGISLYEVGQYKLTDDSEAASDYLRMSDRALQISLLLVTLVIAGICVEYRRS